MARNAVKLERRHFELIAAVIRDLGEDNLKAVVAGKFAEALAPTNPLFNHDRFIKAATK
jgi:hypothetical protein